MTTHFDPYTAEDDDPPEVAPCGTRLGENCDMTGNWSQVTCKRCLASRDRLQQEFDHNEAKVVEQMGDAVEFFMADFVVPRAPSAPIGKIQSMTIPQLAIAFAKYITGLRPGDDGWGPEDDQAYTFALYDKAFTSEGAGDDQAV